MYDSSARLFVFGESRTWRIVLLWRDLIYCSRPFPNNLPSRDSHSACGRSVPHFFFLSHRCSACLLFSRSCVVRSASSPLKSPKLNSDASPLILDLRFISKTQLSQGSCHVFCPHASVLIRRFVENIEGLQVLRCHCSHNGTSPDFDMPVSGLCAAHHWYRSLVSCIEAYRLRAISFGQFQRISSVYSRPASAQFADQCDIQIDGCIFLVPDVVYKRDVCPDVGHVAGAAVEIYVGNGI